MDPELERRLAERLRAELEREVGPRPVWGGAPPEALSDTRRRSSPAALAAAVMVVVLASVGGVLVAFGSPSPSPSASPSPSGSLSAVASPSATAQPTVPPGPFDVLYDGRSMSGDGWRLVAATYRVLGEPTPSPASSQAGSIWVVTDPSSFDKVWIAIGRLADPPSVDPARELIIAIDTTVGVEGICGDVVIGGVAFDHDTSRVIVRYENATTVAPVPTPSEGLPSGVKVVCPLIGHPALLVFALERAAVPSGPITIDVVRGGDTSEARAFLVAPPSPSIDPVAPILDAGFVSPDFGWVRFAHEVITTNDGGQTWQTAWQSASTTFVIEAASFSSPSQGWVVGREPDSPDLVLWRTIGRQWTPTALPHSSHSPEVLGNVRIVWIDEAHVVIDVEGGMGTGYADDIFATSDGGRTWPVAVNAGETGLPVFADSEHGFLIGGPAGDRVFATQDGGRTWGGLAIPALTDKALVNLYDGRFFSPSEGLIFGSYGEASIPFVLRTSDGGRSWQLDESASKPADGCSILSVDTWTCIDPFTGFVNVWTESGKAWTQAAMSGLPPDAQAHLIDPDHGWATDPQEDPGGLYLTTDGGITWQRIVPGP